MDHLSRRVGFRRYAEKQAMLQEPTMRQTLIAFTQGVTDGARRGSSRPAHEFTPLRTKPTPYNEVAVLALLNYVSFILSTWPAKLTRLILLERDGPEAASALSSEYAPWLPVTAPVVACAGSSLAAERPVTDLARLSRAVREGGASNNRALRASCTATGHPLLANDPHLVPSLPPHWYPAHVRTPEWEAAKACFAGAPGFPAGHNGFAAWGVTAGLADNFDLYLEEVGPDGCSVREGDNFVPCQVIIEIRDADPVEEQIRLDWCIPRRLNACGLDGCKADPRIVGYPPRLQFRWVQASLCGLAFFAEYNLCRRHGHHRLAIGGTSAKALLRI